MAKGSILLICLSIFCLRPDVALGNLPPHFIKDMNLEVIKEDTPVGTSVFQLEGQDPEKGSVSYGLTGTSLFTVDANSGIVKVARPLISQAGKTLKFNVIIEDKVGSGQNNNKVVNPIAVVILDVNNNGPEFHEDGYEAIVPEDTSVGTTILKWINMTDSDSIGENLTVSCISQHPFSDCCDTIDVVTRSATSSQYSGFVVLKKRLDYDQHPFFHCVLQGSDETNNATTTITIHIHDVQNKPPKFIGSLIGSIEESAPTGTAVITLQAKDGDKSNPRPIVYDILSNPGNFFSISPETGEIQVANPMDRESMTSGTIALRVRVREVEKDKPLDDPSSSASTEVHIAVQDVNDEAPRFSSDLAEVVCLENTMDGSLLKNFSIFVSDADASAKSDLSISLLDPSGFFDVDTHKVAGSGLLQIRTKNDTLDFENPSHRKFILLIVAKESSTFEKLSSTATVTVIVQDVNDNAPRFDRQEYSASVMESAPPGTSIATIIATDRDSGVFGSTGLRYRLFGEGAEKFHVNQTTGQISVAEPKPGQPKSLLDFETEVVYHLTYQARDDEDRGMLSAVPLRINVLDADDNPPSFLKELYVARINEGDSEFTPRLIVEAKDRDETSALRYLIREGNTNSLFKIDSFTGEIKSVNSSDLLSDAVKSNRFNLTIQVTDSGNNSATTTVLVIVQDSNNNIPVFDKKYYESNISESSKPGSHVARALAMDFDAMGTGNITYQISRGGKGNFVIEETSGEISVSREANFDYDKKSLYNIEVIAVDHGSPKRTATTTVSVIISDSNNKPPVFTPKLQMAQVFEDAKIGDVIYTLNATDPDADSASSLEYFIFEQENIVTEIGKELSLNVNNTFFEVDKNTGDVKVIKELRRNVEAEVTLRVKVVDTSAEKPQIGSGTLVISIIDINDAPPKFPSPWTHENPAIMINVLEEQPVGSIVYTFVAMDEDSNIAGYAIIPDDDHFEIDTISGVVTTRHMIDYETAQHLEFLVVAFDSGIPQLSATALVTATITNINDNDPLFNQTEYYASIDEHSPAGTHVIRVQADDKDLGDFGHVRYKIVGEFGKYFEIDAEGLITVGPNALLDRENVTAITIYVTAMDSAPDELVRRSVLVPVHINLLDINDHSPRFSQREYRASVMDSILVFPPTPILQISATDDDFGINAEVIYKIISGNDDGTFVLNPRSGVLFPAVSLAGGTKRNHELRVEARDLNGTGTNNDQAIVSVLVQEINFNAPRLMAPPHKNSTAYVYENVLRGDNILWTIRADDPDPGANGEVHYYIKSEDMNLIESDPFAINPNSGQLRLIRALDREEVAKYTLVVAARDSGVPQPFESLHQLSVVVQDVNDNEPQFPQTMFTAPYTFTVQENLPVGALVGQIEAFDADIRENAVVYYFLSDASEEGFFAVDRQTGSIYTNRSLDFERRQHYDLIVKAANNETFMPRRTNRDTGAITKDNLDNSTAAVRVHVVDINDNVPTFPQASYLAGISGSAKIGDHVGYVTAIDPDQDDNGTLKYSVEKTTLFTLGTRTSAKVLDQSPFLIGADGAVTTGFAMNLYQQDHFKLIIRCRETSLPGRSSTTTLEIWVYDNEQLMRVVITRPPRDVHLIVPFITKQLSDASGGSAILTEVRHHEANSEDKTIEWSDLLFLVIDNERRVARSIPEVLSTLSLKTDLVNKNESGYTIVDISSLSPPLKITGFDPVLGTFIALCIVLLIGIIIMLVVIQCLRKWYKDKRISIVKRTEIIPEPQVTTENPLWIDQDSPVWMDQISKMYEEQELSMHVTPDQERHNKRQEPAVQPDVMYATVRRNAKPVRENVLAMEAVDGYATLNGAASRTKNSANGTNGTNGTLRSAKSDYHEMHQAMNTLDRTPNKRQGASPPIPPPLPQQQFPPPPPFHSSFADATTVL